MHTWTYMCSQADTQAYSEGSSFQQVTRKPQPYLSQTLPNAMPIIHRSPFTLPCAPLNHISAQWGQQKSEVTYEYAGVLLKARESLKYNYSNDSSGSNNSSAFEQQSGALTGVA